MSDALSRLYRQAPLDTLTPPGIGRPAPGALPGSALLDPDRLAGLMSGFGEQFGSGEDPRAIVSVWSKYHFNALVVPTLVANLLLQRDLPVGLDQVYLELTETGETRRLWLPHEGVPLISAEPHARFSSLIKKHCEPLIAALASYSGASPRVFWGNLGHAFEHFARACAHHPQAAVDASLPALQMLESRLRPDGSRNALYQPVRYLDLGGDAPSRVRRLCCIRYRLPGKGYCASCPLKSCNRPVTALSRNGTRP